MRTTLLLLLVALPLLILAQEKGIHFEHGLTWEQVKEKARAENKYIFMDCFTTWCGPCKAMAKYVFTQKEAGDFFNKNFINIKVQLDSTIKDADEVKRWYAVSRHIGSEYAINTFPTFLFFNPEGEVVHKITGGVQDVKEFVDFAAQSLDSNKQLYTLKRKYENGDRSLAVLKASAIQLLNNDKKAFATQIFNEWLAAEKNPVTNDNIELLARFTETSDGAAFVLLMNNFNTLHDTEKRTIAEKALMHVIAAEEIKPALSMENNGADTQWDNYKIAIEKKYPQIKMLTDETIADARIKYYQSKGDLKNYAPAVIAYMNAYGTKVSVTELNEFAWDFFLAYNDKQYLSNALAWSKLTLTENNPAYIDTYANILYRSGRKQEALACEEKAILLATDAYKSRYKETLKKMKMGIKIWKQ